ncbi:MAG: hypothetical protein Q4D21_03290 [Phascolarctobacterium sp.]|nr:hypothetical protein [Phascolarctobacterium sp.]
MKAKNIFLSVLAAGCLSVACLAEAASVALLPLIDKSDYENKEELTATYNAAAVRAINNVEGFTLVDSDELTAVLDKNLPEGTLPTEQALKNIAAQTGVDVIFAMQLDNLSSDMTMGKIEDYLYLDLRGRVVYYNALTGKFKSTSVRDDNKVPMATMARSNFEIESFRDNVRRQMNKALGNKKFKADPVKFGW